jgi:hypothetical protein
MVGCGRKRRLDVESRYWQLVLSGLGTVELVRPYACPIRRVGDSPGRMVRWQARIDVTSFGCSTRWRSSTTGSGRDTPTSCSSRRLDRAARQRGRPPAGRAGGVRRDRRSARATFPREPQLGHPPLEDDVRITDEGWGLVEDPLGLFGPTIVRWYPTVQWFNGDGFADLLSLDVVVPEA